LEICALASGSKGNAVYVGSEGQGVLIDAGLSGRELEGRLRAKELDPSSVKAVVMTHEHRDHASGAGVWARRFKVPLYAAYGVDAAMRRVMGENSLKGVEVINFAPDAPFTVADMEFKPFPTSHDATSAVGFRIDNGRTTLGFATDLGEAGSEVIASLLGADALYLESNHEVELLMEGPYPYFLKKRIRGALGHLSNAECATLLASLVHSKLKAVILGHLSEVNNKPKIAFESAAKVLKDANAHEDIPLLVARQGVAGRLLSVA
jgi:phosphoribosyl 1,2-cyclic phosphodiesterase